MKRLFSLLIFSACGSAVVVGIGVAESPSIAFRDIKTVIAGVFFTESTTPEALQAKYARIAGGGEKIRVLIVPGHDDESWGTEFRGVREADMTAELGEELTRLLSRDPSFQPVLVRARSGYAEGFSDYIKKGRDGVRAFVSDKKKIMKEAVRSGAVSTTVGVIHNYAPTDVAEKLYAINAWANEHGVDIVLHLHFNDYPGRRNEHPGRYNGLSIYIPDAQFSNARASKAVAKSLFEQLSKLYAGSNLPLEDSGVVEDQELIAVGAYNTLDPVSVLIEYGYIYEQKFLDANIRRAVIKDLAFQTVQGLNRFFGKGGELFERYQTTLLPHTWQEPVRQGVTDSASVLSLQAALFLEGMYPPEGESKNSCPLTGSFGPCTMRAVKGFQQKYGLPASGTVGELTLAKLNEKYSR